MTRRLSVAFRTLTKRPLPIKLVGLVITLLWLSACSQQEGLVTSTGSNQVLSTPSISVITTQPVLYEEWQNKWLTKGYYQLGTWEGIILGKTSVSNALNLLEQNLLIKRVYSEDYSDSKTSSNVSQISWDWKGEDSNPSSIAGISGYAGYDVSRLIYSVNFIAFIPFDFDDVIKIYGEPSHVIAYVHINPDGGDYSAGVYLVYLDKGFTLSTGNANSVKPVIASNLKLDRLSLFIPSKQGFDLASGGSLIQSKLLVKWQGFQSFDFYCRTPYSDSTRNCDNLLKGMTTP